MRWSVILGGVGLTLAAFAGGASAQYGYPTPYPGPYYPGPYGATPPGYPTPVMPYAPTMPPGAYRLPQGYPAAPGLAPSPGANRLPGTTPPTAPSTPEAGTTPPTTTPGAASNALGAGFGAGATAGTGTDAGAGAGASQGSAAESRGEGGSDALASASPSMYGDVFGGGLRQVMVKLPTTQRIGGTFRSTTTGQPAVFNYANNPVQARPTFITPSNTTVFGTPISENFVASNPLTGAGNQQVYPLLPNSQDRAATLAFAQQTIGPDGTLTYVSDPSVSRATPTGSPGTQPNTLGANIATFYDYTQLLAAATTFLPTPSSGGLVGRTKIAEDNSPLPRDRVIFNYDYFGGVDFGPKGQGVHRFSPGVEMTFFDQWTSVEFRMPFASTINANIVSDGATADGVLLGNAHVTLKGLLYRSDWLYIAAGLGIGAPTGADVGLRTESGTQLLRMINESVILSPYVAALFLPTEDIYLMGFYAVDFDTMGTSVEVNQGGDRLRNVGRIYDAPFQQIDGQVGAWLYRCRDEYALVRGVMSFLELHYNMTLGNGNGLSGANFLVTDPLNFSELNVTAGVTTTFGTNALFTVGASFPVLGGDDKSFDFQIGVRANIFFGPTARNRSIATTVSSF